MSIDKILGFFQPKDKTFYPLFEQAGENTVAIATLLYQLVREDDQAKREDLIRDIEHQEHIGDDITHNIMQNLNTVFITPFDREDIHTLATTLDDVADHIKDAALRFRLFNLKTIPVGLVKLAELILNGAEEVKSAMTLLSKGKYHDQLQRSIIDINNIENQADSVFEMAMTELFTQEKDPIEIIKIKDIIAKMESATDRCEDIANVIESILVKTT